MMPGDGSDMVGGVVDGQLKPERMENLMELNQPAFQGFPNQVLLEISGKGGF